jgi:HK97 gp10 family phage protein
MSVTLKLEGADQLMEALRKLGADAQAEARKAVEATAIEVRGDIVKGYQKGPKSGQVYDSIFRMINGRPVPIGPRQGNNLSATHQASAPGEAPATDTGRLVSSTEYRLTGAASAEVQTSVEYGPFLEWGTQRIEPRPLWRPTVIAAGPKFRARMETAIERAMR